MQRRTFLKRTACAAATFTAHTVRNLPVAAAGAAATSPTAPGDAIRRGRLARWEKNIIASFSPSSTGWSSPKRISIRLIATNRDFMWNHVVAGAKFQRIDGGQPDPRWENSPGVLWTALVPYNDVIRKVFVANHNPTGWDGLVKTPWFTGVSALVRVAA